MLFRPIGAVVPRSAPQIRTRFSCVQVDLFRMEARIPAHQLEMRELQEGSGFTRDGRGCLIVPLTHVAEGLATMVQAVDEAMPGGQPGAVPYRRRKVRRA